MKLWEIGKAVVSGVLQIPADLYYGGRRTLEDVGVFGAEVRRQNAEERARVGKLIIETIRNRATITRLTEIVVQDFMEKLPDSTQDKLHDSLKLAGIKTASKKGTQLTLSSYIGRKLTEKIVTNLLAKRLAKFGVGVALSAVLIQGMIERASNASQRLAKANPALFRKLKQANLDMIYFMAEEQLAPFVATDVLRLKNPQAFDAFTKQLEDSLK